MKNILTLFVLLCGVASATAQSATSAEEIARDPAVSTFNTAPARTEFISYPTRESAEKRDMANNPYYYQLQLEASAEDVYSASVDIPYMWLDRDVFLRVDGVSSFFVSVNGQRVGYGEDSRSFSEFNISPYVTDGQNRIEITYVGGSGMLLEPQSVVEPRAFVFSQPKLRIADYIVVSPLDSTGDFANFEVKAIVANSYNSAEKITIGYDLYTPEGTLKEYSIREITVPGHGRDTVSFSEKIYGAKERLWSADDPKMYYGILSVRRDGRMIEYVPYTIGFGQTMLDGDKITRNGKEIEVKFVRYDSAADQGATVKQLTELKKQGYNTVWPNFTQPEWFYDACETVGLYVIDQANVNPDHELDNARVGGAYSNDPRWAGSYLQRMRAMYERNKNRACVIGWSPGKTTVNGYNMYESYRLLKSLDRHRAVIFSGADGDWNSDLPLSGEPQQ